MNPIFQRAWLGARLVLFAGLLTSCGSGEDSSPVTFTGRLQGYSCDDYYVVVDLESAGAEVAHRRHRTLDCAIRPELADAGCRFYAQEHPNRPELDIAIQGCSFDLADELFRCGFSKGEVSALNDFSTAGCCFQNTFCDSPLPVCFSDETSGASCEICDNGVDEDADGLVDCDDPYCARLPVCDAPTTTVTNTTSTTAMPVTTTTLLDVQCDLLFRLVDSATAGSLQWRTDYGSAPGAFAHVGDAVQCESLVDGALSAFHDSNDERHLDSGLVRLEGIEGPADLARCRFLSSGLLQATDFQVLDIEAATPDLELIDPPPSIVVISADCGPVAAATATDSQR